MARNGRPNYCIATRAQVITLKEVGQTNEQISETTGVSIRHIRQLYANALNRGYDPAVSKQLKDEYFVEAPRSGRPKKITESLKQEVLQSVRKSRKGRTQTLIELARETGGPRSLKGVGYMSIHRILRQAGMKKVKPTRKPGLTDAQKEARLAFCLKHKDWTLEDWKDVIWSDETSVVFGQRRGAERVWRTVQEVSDPTVIRRRWKGYSEFMFWGCFSYDYKGPCHVWFTETTKEKNKAEKDLEARNTEAEPAAKEAWSLRQVFEEWAFGILEALSLPGSSTRLTER